MYQKIDFKKQDKLRIDLWSLNKNVKLFEEGV